MVQTRRQARRKAPSVIRKGKILTSCAPKLPQIQKFCKTKYTKTLGTKPSLTSQVRDLLDRGASEDTFKALLMKSQDQLNFVPPLAFDNIHTEDVFYHALHKQRLDVLPLMLEKQNLDNWNCLHLAVIYDDMIMVERLRDSIPELGYAADRSGRTPLHLAFTKCNAQIARLLLESRCWENYNGDDSGYLGHLAVEALAFDYRKSGMCEWARLIEWLYNGGGMDIGTKDLNGETALTLAQKWDVFYFRVKCLLMGRK